MKKQILIIGPIFLLFACNMNMQDKNMQITNSKSIRLDNKRVSKLTFKADPSITNLFYINEKNFSTLDKCYIDKIKKKIRKYMDKNFPDTLINLIMDFTMSNEDLVFIDNGRSLLDNNKYFSNKNQFYLLDNSNLWIRKKSNFEKIKDYLSELYIKVIKRSGYGYVNFSRFVSSNLINSIIKQKYLNPLNLIISMFPEGSSYFDKKNFKFEIKKYSIKENRNILGIVHTIKRNDGIEEIIFKIGDNIYNKKGLLDDETDHHYRLRGINHEKKFTVWMSTDNQRDINVLYIQNDNSKIFIKKKGNFKKIFLLFLISILFSFIYFYFFN